MAIKHGYAGTPTYAAWKAMKARCHNPNVKSYQEYGARGVSVCQRWRASFAAFLEDMGEKPSPQHTLDRRENTKGYEPGNVRWATQREQQQNKTNNVLLTHNGQTKVLTEWARQAGVSLSTLKERLARGWPLSEAVTMGPRQMERKGQALHEMNGERRTLKDWSKAVGLNPATVQCRLQRGWSLEKALTQKPQART
jgi:lambda repressor-like predicted transcriptional regulator